MGIAFHFKKLMITISLVAGLTAVKASIRLPALVGSNMVLQQNALVRIWGWAEPSEKVVIYTSWNNQYDSTITTRDANWEIFIKTPKGGGPYTICLKGQNSILLENIGIGEVWLCSGQSNMEFGYRHGIRSINDELADASKFNIRFFSVGKSTSDYPLNDCYGEWIVCDSNSLKKFSAVGYYFGKKLFEDLNVPIGLINSSWGGTSAETWTPVEVFLNDSILVKSSGKIEQTEWWPYKKSIVFNAMIAPVSKFTIAGSIWYQGESNTINPETYQKLFSDMIEGWRQYWGYEFPFYFVQIAPYCYENSKNAALLREAQTKTLPANKVGMIVTTDLVDNVYDIHPQNKHEVGFRLANIALAEIYGQEVPYHKSPIYKSADLLNNKILISFENSPEGLMYNGTQIRELYIAAEDRIFYQANAKIIDKKLLVWNEKVKNPAAVRYCFGNASVGNLFGRHGLPVSPFRSDNWEEQTVKYDVRIKCSED